MEEGTAEDINVAIEALAVDRVKQPAKMERKRDTRLLVARSEQSWCLKEVA
jgi:hypothetical protein